MFKPPLDIKQRSAGKTENIGLSDATLSLYFPKDNDDDDERPECEYGTDCYRKNPQHRRDYKHTKKPRPPKRKVGPS